ncbi:TPA: hypothetical protein HA225_04105 [Candidatus Micrarchaeota archaeon]|nr:hypothetical protein [Candidatus Micrarchaeota archaeon]
MYLPVSDVEKTLIDFFHFRERLPQDALVEIKMRMDGKKLGEYLKRCPKRMRVKVRNALAASGKGE